MSRAVTSIPVPLQLMGKLPVFYIIHLHTGNETVCGKAYKIYQTNKKEERTVHLCSSVSELEGTRQPATQRVHVMLGSPPFVEAEGGYRIQQARKVSRHRVSQEAVKASAAMKRKGRGSQPNLASSRPLNDFSLACLYHLQALGGLCKGPLGLDILASGFLKTCRW